MTNEKSLNSSAVEIKGNVNLSGSNIGMLPMYLHVHGHLNLAQCTNFNFVGAGLRVDGDLDLSDTQVNKLPNDIMLGGSLYLVNCPITELPEKLTIPGNLFLVGTKIKRLPDGLRVGGDLMVDDEATSMVFVDGMFVGGEVRCPSSPTYHRHVTETEQVQVCKDDDEERQKLFDEHMARLRANQAALKEFDEEWDAQNKRRPIGFAHVKIC